VLERRSSPSVPRVCARARACVWWCIRFGIVFSIGYLYLFGCVCVSLLEYWSGRLRIVCLFARSEFDVIVYSELYRSNGHHQPWLWQVPANACCMHYIYIYISLQAL
jgi:hypothetical protein